MPTKSAIAKESQAPSVFAGEIEGFNTKNRLSKRESDIVMSLIRNITNSEEIAKHLGISTHTVNNHLKSIFEKTSTKSKTEILSSFLRFAADRLQARSLYVRRPRVLIIDDEEMICEFVANGLRDRGMRTHALTDPSKAIDMISTLSIDFVVCDIRMPTMSGMDLLKEVRKTYRCWPHFAFITGYPDFSLEECMHYGAVGFVEKPLDIDKVFRLIMGHLTESSDERAEFFAADASEPVVLPEPCALDEADIGFGGAFIPMETSLQKKSRLSVGSVVDLTLSTRRSETMRVRGQVVWKRASKEAELKPGVGVRFLAMSDQDQQLFDSFLVNRDVTSFIPLGGEHQAVS